MNATCTLFSICDVGAVKVVKPVSTFELKNFVS